MKAFSSVDFSVLAINPRFPFSCVNLLLTTRTIRVMNNSPKDIVEQVGLHLKFQNNVLNLAAYGKVDR